MKTILIADDDRDLLVFLVQVLSAEGFRVVSTDNGREVLDLVLREHPDAVLLDSRLGTACGIDICRQIRESPENREMPIALMSAYPYLDLDGCLATTVLPKPFSVEEVQSMVHRLIPQ